ncbi:MAG: VIT1/CCC1 transporter family protein [Candidatus Micrarchaeaceae archaeon]|jgi:VIT1/CCC1 family predicted Fe2+/Mn2+ transporter
MTDKSEYFEELYANEVFHYHVLRRLASMEKDRAVKSLLENLSAEELKHSHMWGEIPGVGKLGGYAHQDSLAVGSTAFIRRLFGLQLTIKVMEYSEILLEKRLDQSASEFKFTKNESGTIRRVEASEMKSENVIKTKLLEYSSVLTNIRNVILGMNDGLVEILGAVAGFAAALQQPALVIVAGIIVAIAGTLSMTGGVYLSVDYEKSVYKKKKTESSSKAAGLYTGIAYIVGALVPLLPFLFGASGYYALGISILITAVILSIVSVLVSIISDTPILMRIVKTLLISLGIVAITITLGVYARNVLHLSI